MHIFLRIYSLHHMNEWISSEWRAENLSWKLSFNQALPGWDYSNSVLHSLRETHFYIWKDVCYIPINHYLKPWWLHWYAYMSPGFSEMRYMMTSSNGNIFRVTGHFSGEFTGPRWIPAQRPVTQSVDVFFDLRLNKRLSKQSWGWWFETLPRPLWRHSNVLP